MPSWEYYQQTEAGNQFELYWVCGLPVAFSRSIGGNFSEFPLSSRNLEVLFAVPFDQLIGVTVSKILFSVRGTTGTGAGGDWPRNLSKCPGRK